MWKTQIPAQKLLKVGVIGITVGLITVFHYQTAVDAGLRHVIFRELYFLPIILGGFWFGMRGGLSTSLVITILYGPLVLIGPGRLSPHDLGNTLEILLFNLVGGLLGWLKDREVGHQARLREAENLAAMGRATAMIAHDLKTPLVTIGGLARQLYRKITPGTSEQEKIIVILQQTERMRGELGDYAQGLKGHVRLLANTSALSEFLPETLAAFLTAYPNIDVDIEERPSYEMVEAISQGLADAGILSDAVDLGDLEIFPFGHDQLVVIVPHGHRFTERRTIAFHEVLDEELVGMSYSSALQQYLGHQAAPLGRQPRLRVRVNSFEAVGRMVEQGVGLAILPDSAALRCRKSMDIASIPLAEAWALRRLIICCRRFAALPVHAQRLIEHLTAAGAAPDVERAPVPEPA